MVCGGGIIEFVCVCVRARGVSLEYGQVCVNVRNEGFVYDVSFAWLCALSRLCVCV